MLHLYIPPHPFTANRWEILDMAPIRLPGGEQRGFEWIDVGDLDVSLAIYAALLPWQTFAHLWEGRLLQRRPPRGR